MRTTSQSDVLCLSRGQDLLALPSVLGFKTDDPPKHMTTPDPLVESRFRLAAARHVLGILTTGDARAAANLAVERGICTPALVELAIPRDRQTQDVSRQFLAALRELGGVLPSRMTAEETLLSDLMARIASREISPRAGTSELLSLQQCLASATEPEAYVGAAHGIAELIGYGYAYSDFDEEPGITFAGRAGVAGLAAMDDAVVGLAVEWLRARGA